MANDYALEMSPDLDPETAAELRRLLRQQQIADAMTQRGMQPLQGQMVGGVYVRPSMFQGLANMANSYMADKRNEDIDKQFASLGEKRAGKKQAAIDAMMTGAFGTPEKVEQLPEDVYGPPQITPATQPTTEGKRQALIQAMTSNMPEVRNAGSMIFKIDEANAAKKAALEQRMFELQMKMEDSRVAREDRLAAQKELAQMRIDAQKEMRQMAGALRQPPAPSMTEVIDPKDQTRLIRVNARTYQGGSLGDAGVLGISGKEPVAAKRTEEVDSGRSGVTDLAVTLKDKYDQLNKNSGIVSTERGTLSNIASGISNSGVGQYVGRMVGTENQKLREEIKQTRPLLLQAIKKATGMSAKQMDSNVELKMYLAAATDPDAGYEANKSALENLDRLFGLGGLGKSAVGQSSPNVDALLEKYK